jgi:ASC-1-like (ASCH) protein
MDELKNKTKKVKINSGSNDLMCPKARGILCTKKYIHLIRDCKKTVEGRVNDPKYKSIKAGTYVRFYYMSNAKDDVTCLVTNVNKYQTFEEMLTNEGISNCIPGESNMEVALNIYRSFPGYEQKEKNFGVIALRLEVYIKNSK